MCEELITTAAPCQGCCYGRSPLSSLPGGTSASGSDRGAGGGPGYPGRPPSSRPGREAGELGEGGEPPDWAESSVPWSLPGLLYLTSLWASPTASHWSPLAPRGTVRCWVHPAPIFLKPMRRQPGGQCRQLHPLQDSCPPLSSLLFSREELRGSSCPIGVNMHGLSGCPLMAASVGVPGL